jgi:plasmid stabilization system protein ParE
MTWRLIVREEAEADLTAAAVWYEDQRAGLGVEFTAEIREATRWIVTHPQMLALLRLVPPVRRVIPHRFPYRIFYYTHGDAAVVFAVLLAARSDQTWKQRL